MIKKHIPAENRRDVFYEESSPAGRKKPSPEGEGVTG